MSEDREVLSEVWGGRVPAIFNLAEQDGTAEPCCLMLPRMSYLPLVTEKVKSFRLNCPVQLAYFSGEKPLFPKC